MSSKRALAIVGILAAFVFSGGCSFLYYADFPISVGNRTGNTIKVFANGAEMGDVGAGETRPFNVRLRTLNNSGSLFSPTEQAEVTFYAKDLKTGALSREKRSFVQQDRPTNVEFNTSDFLY